MHTINHPAKRLLLNHKNQGVSTKVTTPPWSPERIRQAIARGPHLERVLRHILLSDPHHGPVYLIKIDISDGFFRIDLNPDDIPRLGVVFPTEPGQEPPIAFPLFLPMGWKNSPPAFTTASETIADIANDLLKAGRTVPPHALDERASRQDKILDNSGKNPCAKLPSQQQPIAEVDVYVDVFIALAQGDHKRLKNVRATVLHSIDSVFDPTTSVTPRPEPSQSSLERF
jgi:Reverse transcriptase (RNA-dependent DNA polymerase).